MADILDKIEQALRWWGWFASIGKADIVGSGSGTNLVPNCGTRAHVPNTGSGWKQFARELQERVNPPYHRCFSSWCFDVDVRRVREKVGMQSGKKRTLRSLNKEEPSREEWTVIANELRSSSDRSVSILIAAVVENVIAESIANNLPRHSAEVLEQLYARDGALSSFFSVINLGYAMALYDDEIRDDLNVIRKIRNSFAHTRKPISFRTIEISDECKKIKTIKNILHPVSVTYPIKEGINSDERWIYINTGLAISKYLSLRLLRRFVRKARISKRKAETAHRKAEALQQQMNELDAIEKRMSVLDVIMSEHERNEILEKLSLTMSQSDFDAVNVQLELLAIKYNAQLPPRFLRSLG